MTDERPTTRPRKLGDRGLHLIALLEDFLGRATREVDAFIGDTPTTQAQFDALVCWQYRNGGLANSKLGLLHRAGDYSGAARQLSLPAERRLYQS